MTDSDGRVETAFDWDGRIMYLNLLPEELPQKDELVHFGGSMLQGFPYNGDYMVREVTRSYDTETGRLVFVNVDIDLRISR